MHFVSGWRSHDAQRRCGASQNVAPMVQASPSAAVGSTVYWHRPLTQSKPAGHAVVALQACEQYGRRSCCGLVMHRRELQCTAWPQ
jgi:hypothetical protein